MSDIKFAFRPLVLAVLGLALLAPAAVATQASAQDGYRTSYDDSDDGYAPPRDLSGADIAHDYTRHYYYDYDGAPPRDRRADEQSGWRDGTLHTPPRWYWGRCGCSSIYYGHRWYSRPANYDYDERVFDERAHFDHRTSYEYRWPRRAW